MATSGASARIDYVEVVLPNYVMKPNIFGVLPAMGAAFFLPSVMQNVWSLLKFNNDISN